MFKKTFTVGPIQCNCSIIACEETKEAIIIDPGGDSDKIKAVIDENGLKPKYILHTHAHFDHVLGAKALKTAFADAKICLNKGDEWLYNNLDLQCGLFGMKSEPVAPIDIFIEDEEEFKIGNLNTKTIYTPGHTPGSLCFCVADKENIVFSGDTLFNGGIGRTDLWGGSYDDIIKSIKNRLLNLDNDTTVIPGHGSNTSIWQEKKQNPFLV